MQTDATKRPNAKGGAIIKPQVNHLEADSSFKKTCVFGEVFTGVLIHTPDFLFTP